MARARCQDIPFFPSLLFPLLLRFFFKFFHLNCRQSHPQHCHHHRANITNTNQEIGHCDWTWRQIINTLLFLTIHDQHWGLFGCTRRVCNWLFAPMTTNKQPCRKQFRIWGFWSQSCKRVAFKSFQSDWIHRTLCIADCVWTVLFDLVYLVWGTRVLFRFDRSFFFFCSLFFRVSVMIEAAGWVRVACCYSDANVHWAKWKRWQKGTRMKDFGSNWDPVHLPPSFVFP